MYYSSFGFLAIILHFILNSHMLKVKSDREEAKALYRYKYFLISVMVYYFIDVSWGALYDTRITPLVYAATFSYFLAVAVSVFLWTRFVVTYLDRKALFGKFLTFAGWTVFLYQFLNLIVNFFYPIAFKFASNGEYRPMSARYISLAMQVIIFFVTAIYTLAVAIKTEGKVRNHNLTVCVSGLVMTVFIVLQTLYPLMPFYAIGLLIGTSMIHVFIEVDERSDHEIEMGRIKENVERVKLESEHVKKKNVTFGEIAESLAENYDVVYYIDTTDESYIGYTSNRFHGLQEISKRGDEFFEVAIRYMNEYAYPDDRDRILTVLDKDYLLAALRSRKQFTIDVRIMDKGGPEYTRFSARKTTDSKHLLITVENVDEEIRKEKAQQKALNSEKELARRDELTGTKNKTAYIELEQSVQDNIDKGIDYLPFALAVCDINDLKIINDTQGHQAGDDYIKDASKLLCDIFTHSPVFRVGGDEFVIFLRGDDYSAKEELMMRLKTKIYENCVKRSGPIIAVGVASYIPESDTSISQVFERADNLMYEDKKELKAM